MNVRKILIFSLAYYPKVGGAEVAIKEITDRISDIEFHLVTLRFSPVDAAEERLGNVRVHRIGDGTSYFGKMFFVWQAAHFARSLHAKEKFNGSWVMMSYMLLPLILANLSVPHALTLQEGDTYDHMFLRPQILPFVGLLNKGFRTARVVSAISTYLARWAKRRGYETEVEVIPNGVDVAKFTGAPVSHEGLMLMTASRLVHKNGIDVILHALAQLPAAKLLVAGVGEEEQMLKRLAKQLGVSSQVEWLGYVDHARLPELLHRSDVFIRPSRSEGMGNAFVEAMAAGVPVIATQEGGLKDFVTPEVAWVVSKDRPEQIAAAVSYIVGNPEHTKKVIENAKHLAAKYDWSLIARDMREKVFARLFE